VANEPVTAQRPTFRVERWSMSWPGPPEATQVLVSLEPNREYVVASLRRTASQSTEGDRPSGLAFDQQLVGEDLEDPRNVAGVDPDRTGELLDAVGRGDLCDGAKQRPRPRAAEVRAGGRLGVGVPIGASDTDDESRAR
jgi:hypothetical protein